MAQDMKLVMHMIRAAAYKRLAPRLGHEQTGWLQGWGTFDPAIPMTNVVQQRARLQKDLYVMYIDLATFFPRVDREALTIAEALVGLPNEVVSFVRGIYGHGRASKDTDSEV